MSAHPPVLPNSMTPCCFHPSSFIQRQIASSTGIEAVPSECARMTRSPDKIHDILPLEVCLSSRLTRVEYAALSGSSTAGWDTKQRVAHRQMLTVITL